MNDEPTLAEQVDWIVDALVDRNPIGDEWETIRVLRAAAEALRAKDAANLGLHIAVRQLRDRITELERREARWDKAVEVSDEAVAKVKVMLQEKDARIAELEAEKDMILKGTRYEDLYKGEE